MNAAMYWDKCLFQHDDVKTVLSRVKYSYVMDLSLREVIDDPRDKVGATGHSVGRFLLQKYTHVTLLISRSFLDLNPAPLSKSVT